MFTGCAHCGERFEAFGFVQLCLASGEVVEDSGHVCWCGGEDGFEFFDAVAGVEQVDRVRGLLGELWLVMGEPDSSVERVVDECSPLLGEVGIGGLGAVSDGVVVEFVGVAPLGERLDVFVVDVGTDRVAGPVACPEAEPVGRGGAVLMEELAASLFEGFGEQLELVQFNVVFGESARSCEVRR